jgi:integrin-linked kinase-associated serine/threonine phosphatase 2C
VKAGQLRALVISKEHLAVYPAERARIERAKGTVSADGRLNGRMQV